MISACATSASAGSEIALGRFENADRVTVSWRSMELDPEARPERTGELAEQLARKYCMAIRGVPTFIVDRTIGVMGAQPLELLLEICAEGGLSAKASSPHEP
jgi:predicted DsbA family dithiol-disulfide isomerase